MNSFRVAPPIVILIDVVLVAVFCVIGRLSHDSGIVGDIPGTLNTMWPFLAAVLIAHAVVLLLRWHPERLMVGLLVWAVTVVGGLLLRVASGQGTALPFTIVATLTLALFLLGWRAIYALVRRARRRSRA
ncbi:DUF3054 domain-containing protein [Microbacterium sp. A82]|uniref:DUF3054 domain-containing protein n=1 Tax=unclassified Microbacterium TaxID=2609290 RepID=UPI003F416832